MTKLETLLKAMLEASGRCSDDADNLQHTKECRDATIAYVMERDTPKLVITVHDETPEQERRRVFGACGGVCGEAPCILWNKENQRRLDYAANNAESRAGEQNRTDFIARSNFEYMSECHANALRGALHMTVAPKQPKPDIPIPQAPLYVAALSAFWNIVQRDYPNASTVVLPQSLAGSFEQAAAGIVEAWINAYSAGGYGDGKFGGDIPEGFNEAGFGQQNYE